MRESLLQAVKNGLDPRGGILGVLGKSAEKAAGEAACLRLASEPSLAMCCSFQLATYECQSRVIQIPSPRLRPKLQSTAPLGVIVPDTC